MARERGGDAVVVVRERDLVGHLLELGAGIAHGDAMARKVEHAHIILCIAKGHDFAARDAKALADARERARLADALDRRLVEPRCRLDEG